jgi:hypothetical protein
VSFLLLVLPAVQAVDSLFPNSETERREAARWEAEHEESAWEKEKEARQKANREKMEHIVNVHEVGQSVGAVGALMLRASTVVLSQCFHFPATHTHCPRTLHTAHRTHCTPHTTHQRPGLCVHLLQVRGSVLEVTAALGGVEGEARWSFSLLRGAFQCFGKVKLAEVLEDGAGGAGGDGGDGAGGGGVQVRAQVRFAEAASAAAAAAAAAGADGVTVGGAKVSAEVLAGDKEEAYWAARRSALNKRPVSSASANGPKRARVEPVYGIVAGSSTR